MKIARDGYLFALFPLAGAALTWLAGWLVPVLVLLGLAAFILFFFRDPEREIPADPDAIVSPADGRVIRIQPEAAGTRLSIFLSVFNVHVNRAPVGGRIEECRHQPGRFLLAFDERASAENEQLLFQIGGLRFSLIAGLVARRIIPWKNQGEEVAKGDRIALIRFGSRVDLLIPPEAELRVRVGDRVRAGSSVIARWSRPT
jgi:phosphatidylserine decarboxylase